MRLLVTSRQLYLPDIFVHLCDHEKILYVTKTTEKKLFSRIPLTENV